MSEFNEMTIEEFFNANWEYLEMFGCEVDDDDDNLAECSIIGQMAAAYAYRRAGESNYFVSFDELAELNGFYPKEWISERAGLIAPLVEGLDMVNAMEATDEGFEIDLWWDDELDAPPKEWWFKDELEASEKEDGDDGKDCEA